MRVALLCGDSTEVMLMWTDGQLWEFAGRDMAIHKQWNNYRGEFYDDTYCLTDVKTGRTVANGYKTIGGLKRAMKRKEQGFADMFERNEETMAMYEALLQLLIERDL